MGKRSQNNQTPHKMLSTYQRRAEVTHMSQLVYPVNFIEQFRGLKCNQLTVHPMLKTEYE